MRTRGALAAFVAAGSLLLAGCAAGESPQPGDDVVATEPGSAASDTAEPDAGSAGSSESVLTFTSTTIDGEEFAAADLAGKPTVFWFWAPWCPTCVSQSPQVLDLAEQHGDDVNVVGVAGLDELAAMEDFIEKTDTDGLTHLNDESGEVWRHFGITAQSTFAVVDENGVVTDTGYLEPDELSARVAELAG
ncbi:redoxin family protein [Promicromonospora panici]|uniref:redoxin family protein n=1 Tax=Promicromonospora panici TaxID=2219658 RepID=UPI00101B93F5|nr:redoxin family protein [Promicromonospora panici]